MPSSFRFLLIIPLLLASISVQAQRLCLGPALGGNLATQYDADKNNPAPAYRLAWLAGGQASLSWRKFAVQPALLYSSKGLKFTNAVLITDPGTGTTSVVSTARVTHRLNYLTLPVNLAYAPVKAAPGFQILAGPYIGVLLGGSSTASVKHSTGITDPTSTSPIRVADRYALPVMEPTYRPLDAGLQGGIAYQIHQLQMQATYSFGLLTTSPAFDSSYGVVRDEQYNRVFQLSTAYLFALNK